jgi:hypothetical protein
MKIRVRSRKLYESLSDRIPGAMQSRVERFRADMKLSDWLLLLPDWGLGQVANFIGLGVKS